MATAADLQELGRILASDGVIWTGSPLVSVWGRRANTRPADSSPRLTTRRRTLDAELEEELARIETRGRLRSLREVQGRLGPRMRVDQCDVWMFGGANYLDLAADPRVLAAASAALVEHGAAAGGARLICGNLNPHERLERALAAFLGCQAALLFSTGYMANLGVLTALAGPDDLIVSDALNHASLIDACRLSGARVEVFTHGRPEAARDALLRCDARRKILVTDGVYSMDGDVAPLTELVEVAQRCGARVVLDDTHGIGVLGENGRGAAELTGVERNIDVVIGNLGKALGSFGAFVGGSTILRNYLINRARTFIFTCALPPASVAAAHAALEVLQAEPERRRTLLDRAAQLRTGLRALGYDIGASATHVVPVIVGDDRAAVVLAAQLLERGFFTQAIRYPSVPRGTARLRLTPMASHQPAQIDELLVAFAGLRRPDARPGV
jgi:8-amino-7-oxononanoate synthase